MEDRRATLAASVSRGLRLKRSSGFAPQPSLIHQNRQHCAIDRRRHLGMRQREFGFCQIDGHPVNPFFQRGKSTDKWGWHRPDF